LKFIGADKMSFSDQFGLAFTHQLLGDITLGLLAISHPDTFKRYVFEPRTSPPPYVDDKVEQLIPPAEHGLLLPLHVAVGISDSGLALEFACHDDTHLATGIPVRPRLATLAAYGPDGAATFIGTTVLDMLRALHPDALAPFPRLTS
jgi:hypothetical protein